jgi:hypothetical protein
MDLTRGQLARTLAIALVLLLLVQPAHAAGFADAITSPIQTFVAALESALSNILALIVPRAAPTASVAPAAQPASGTALSAAAVNAADASSIPPLATAPPPPPAEPQPLADAAIPATQTPPLPSPPAAPIPAHQATEALASLSPAIDTNYVTQQQLAATIAQLQSSINNQLYSSTSTFASGGIWNAIAASQRINNLSGSASGPLTISDATLSNVSGLSASDISGIFSISQGGLGTSTAPTANKLLFSDANGNWEYVATSSLGISGGGGGSGTVGSGTQGQFAFYNANGTTLTATSSLFLAQNGNVGIGTTSPSQPLTVSGNGQFTGHMAIGNAASIDEFWSPFGDNPTGASVLDEHETITSMPDVEYNGILSQSSVNLNSDASAAQLIQGEFGINIDQSNDNAIGFLTNIDGTTINNGSGDIRYMNSLAGEFYNESSGNVTTSYGVYGIVENDGSATITNAASLYAETAQNTATGTIASATGVYVNTPSNSGGGTITDDYGIWVGDQTLSGTCSYALWYDSPGVFRIKNDGVMAYYNPNAPKYQPCGNDYERVVQEWNNNVAEYGTENGGTGQARALAFITASTTRMTIGATGNVGIGATSPYSRLTVWGADAASSTLAFNVVNSASTTLFSVFDGGNAQLSGTLTQSSDQRLKTNIQSLNGSSSLAALNALNPVTFTWINPGQGTTPQLGFIAQQVQQVFPNLISTTSATALTPNGTLGLNYIGLISPIVSAIQALYTDVETLQQTVAGFADNFLSAHITVTTLDATAIHSQEDDTQQLCVGSTCVTPAQFQAMVAAAGASQPAGNAAASPSDTATSSDEEATDTPPVIQLNGANPAIIQVGQTYSDLGAQITGPQQDRNLGIQAIVDGAATTTIGAIEIDTSQPGTHTIEYTATDQYGLEGTATRTVIVEAVFAATSSDAVAASSTASTEATSTVQ